MCERGCLSCSSCNKHGRISYRKQWVCSLCFPAIVHKPLGSGLRRKTLWALVGTTALSAEREPVFFWSCLTYAIRTLCFQSIRASSRCSGEEISFDGHSWKVSSVYWFNNSHVLSRQIILPETLAEAEPKSAGEHLQHIRKAKDRGKVINCPGPDLLSLQCRWKDRIGNPCTCFL